EKIGEAMRRDDVKAIVLIGKNGKFSGGFDINVFQKVQQTGNISLLPDLSIDLVVNRIEGMQRKLSLSTIVAIEGTLHALGCWIRSFDAPKAQLGLPELSLGIIPGAGGTQRLPRLVGLPKAIDMMLTSKPILSEEAKKLGLIDAILSSYKGVTNVVRQWALDIAEKRKPWVRSLHSINKIGSLSEACYN
ncbi:peroxisomal fatty acid beta-oxidation multifunctional protein AIM1-like protein, partial [Tanacetum coccineum]